MPVDCGVLAIINPCTVKFYPMTSLDDMLKTWLMCTFSCSKRVQEHPCKIYHDFTALYMPYVCQRDKVMKWLSVTQPCWVSLPLHGHSQQSVVRVGHVLGM